MLQKKIKNFKVRDDLLELLTKIINKIKLISKLQ